MQRTAAQLSVIRKIDAHGEGPITLTQEECWDVATIIDQTSTHLHNRVYAIDKALQILEPQARRVTPSIVAVREAIAALKKGMGTR